MHLISNRFCVVVLFVIVLFSCSNKNRNETNQTYLSSWNEGNVKCSIISYIQEVTNPKCLNFIPEKDRIAVFELDGILWAEQPTIQFLFMFYHIQKLGCENQNINQNPALKAIFENDTNTIKQFKYNDFKSLFVLTFSGLTQTKLFYETREFLKNFRHPIFKCNLQETCYIPQLELIDYLRKNKFTVYILTNNSVDFVSGFSENFFGVSAKNIIGTRFVYENISRNEIFIAPELIGFNEGADIVTNTKNAIGKQMVFLCGNGNTSHFSPILQKGKYKSFQLLVNHDDEEREFNYAESPKPISDTLAKNKCTIVSMKNDWKTIFPQLY